MYRDSPSCINFLGDLGKTEGVATSGEEYDRQRNQIVEHLRANVDEAELRDVASFMAMELRGFMIEYDRLETEQAEKQHAIARAIEEYLKQEAELGPIRVQKGIVAAGKVGLRLGLEKSPSRIAKKAGIASSAPHRHLKAFARSLYDEEAIRNPEILDNATKARNMIWERVRNESVRIRRPLTPTRGPQTLYKWLTDYKNERVG